MTLQPINVATFTTGLEKDLPDYLIPDDAMPEITNAYTWRKRVIKKYGSTLLGRLQLQITGEGGFAGGPTDYTKTTAQNPVAPGTVTITDGVLTVTDDSSGGFTGDIGAGPNTINYETGVIAITFSGATGALTMSYDYYLRLPCMGLFPYETNNINDENLIAFDTQKAYTWNTTSEKFQNISFDTTTAAISWTGTNHNFFWAVNYFTDAANNRLLWVVNNIVADGIRYFNGSVTNGWTTFRPYLNAATNEFLNTAKIVATYKNRLLFFNTNETVGGTSSQHYQRVRWSQNGSPLDVDAFQSDVAGKGGFINAPTSEQIISVAFFQDTLLVFFERSTWQLVYTGNEILPFIWQRVNSQFGAESTFSAIPFDDGVIAVGDKAIVKADSTGVERIDTKIPDEVFRFNNSNFGVERVHGVRDFYTELALWTVVSEENDNTFPDKMLVLNYRDGGYSYFDVSATCFGQFRYQDDLIWEKALKTWKEYNGATWNSFRYSEKNPLILYGNQQGYVSMLNFPTNTNDSSLYITNITQATSAVVSSADHNLVVGQYVRFENVVGMTEINATTGRIITITTNTFTVDIDSSAMTAFGGYGQLNIVDNIEIKTRRYNPFYKNGQMLRFNYFDLYVEKLSTGEMSVDVLLDDSTNVINTFIIQMNDVNVGMNNAKVWVRNYMSLQGQFLQYRFYLSDTQMKDDDIPFNTIVLYDMTLWAKPTGRLFNFNRAV